MWAGLFALGPLIMLLHQVFKFFALFRGQLASNLLPHLPEFVANPQADLVGERLHSVLAVMNDDLDALALFVCEVELLLHSAGKVAQLAFARYWGGSSDRVGAGLRRGLSQVDGEAAGDDAGGEDHQGGED